MSDCTAPTLTKREQQVLNLIWQGLSSKQVAESLCVSKRTVDSYEECLRRKFGVNSRLSLCREAIRLGLLEVAGMQRSILR